MKLTNLSLAILTAISLAACGGGGGDDKPADPPKPTPDNNNNNNNNNKQPEQPPQAQNPVDPTGTHVVDNKDLSKENTVGTLQYIRREGSQYDRANNPSKQASASPLLGVTLNDQNPKLTNIVFARQNLQYEDGQAVKAQFGGMDKPEPLDEDGNVNYDSLRAGQPDSGRSIQEENFANVDTLAPYNKLNATTDKAGLHFKADNTLTGTDKTRDKLNHDKGVEYQGVQTASPNEGMRGTNHSQNVTAIYAPSNEEFVYDKNPASAPKGDLVLRYKKDGLDGGATGVKRLSGTYAAGTTPAPGAAPTYDGTYTTVSAADKQPDFSKVDKKGKKYAVYQTVRYDTALKLDPSDAAKRKFYVEKKDRRDTVTAELVNAFANGGTVGSNTVDKNEATARRLGYGLVWWSSPVTSFENSFSRNEATHPDFDLGSQTPDEFERDGKAATTGLIRVGGGLETLGEELTYNKDTKKWEDHHNTTSRIFGRYHLATAIEKDGKKSVKQVNYNTFVGARPFTAEYKETDGLGSTNTGTFKATQYSLGAVPATLQYVQYGRVSNQLDLDTGKTGYPDGFVRNYFQRKGTDDSVDNYFYRGTNATTIEQMAALPSNQIATYNGHALMYGIDNSFHGKTSDGKKRDLPNAFAPERVNSNDGALGLGNFVAAAANFGTKRVSGTVYNQWLLDPTKPTLTSDPLVEFAGNIVGNTVVGVANRTYVDGRDDAVFKASFFGEQAQEMGGSFNSVKDDDKYASAYEKDDWGGVFGATKGASNTFQGDDKANVYGSVGSGN